MQAPYNKVIVIPQSKRASGLAMPRTAGAVAVCGEVVSAGMMFTAAGPHPTPLHPGDTVWFLEFGTAEVRTGGRTYYVINFTDVLCYQQEGENE